MIDEPKLEMFNATKTAVIRLTIPRAEIQKVMGPAIGEVLKAVADQGLQQSGPWFTHHLRLDSKTFDFEVGVPIAGDVRPVGRVVASSLPARRVVRTIYRGPCEGLEKAWAEFSAIVKKQAHKLAPDIWECYAKGPESGNDPSKWETELNRPLAE